MHFHLNIGKYYSNIYNNCENITLVKCVVDNHKLTTYVAKMLINKLKYMYNVYVPQIPHKQYKLIGNWYNDILVCKTS